MKKRDWEEQERSAQVHPDCLNWYVGDAPYGSAWRYANDGKPLEWYQDISTVFRYPKAPNKAGWYL